MNFTGREYVRMNNWERFDNRSENYDSYRPRYPVELLDLLRKEVGLKTQSTVADVGSGTGILTELLLESGCRVCCIEPNDAMRKLASEKLGGDGNCEFIKGTAENTSLPDNSVDVVIAGQAFHWFEPKKSKKEFVRILRQNGHVVLVWNTRVKSSAGMNFEYEGLVRHYSEEYHASGAGAISKDAIRDFYDGDFRSFRIRNSQKLDTKGLLGRYLSSSYAIGGTDLRFEQMKLDFANLFKRNETSGYVTIEYETEVFIGEIGKRNPT